MKINNNNVGLHEFINDPYLQSQAFDELTKYQETFEKLGITLEELPAIIRQNELRGKLLAGEAKRRNMEVK